MTITPNLFFLIMISIILFGLLLYVIGMIIHQNSKHAYNREQLITIHIKVIIGTIMALGYITYHYTSMMKQEIDTARDNKFVEDYNDTQREWLESDDYRRAQEYLHGNDE